MRLNPTLYQINVQTWLYELSQRFRQPITFANIPANVVEELAEWGFNLIWLTGVWERSPQGREIAITHPGLQNEYRKALADFQPADVAGSPYAIHRYEVDRNYGGREGLATFREQLRAKGIGIILDYVPNHTAVDHPWTLDYPSAYVHGTEHQLAIQPGYYFRAQDGQRQGKILAHGRDPYYPAWTDTAQIDAFSAEARRLACQTLTDIAAQCDGVRCDMAMLLVTRVFAQTWGQLIHMPTVEFWTEVIHSVRQQTPAFLFLAEVYWDMEAELQNLGFDYTYDKRLYDRLLHESPLVVRYHLLAPLEYHQHMVRFIENHDEMRAATAFGSVKSRAAAVLTFFLPGMKLIHDGQFYGPLIKLPIQLGRRPVEAVDETMLLFYRAMMAELREPHYHEGQFQILGINPVLGNTGDDDLIIAFAWWYEEDWRVVVVNLTERPVVGRVMLNDPRWLEQEELVCVDMLHHDFHLEMPSSIVPTNGLMLTLEPYMARILKIQGQAS